MDDLKLAKLLQGYSSLAAIIAIGLAGIILILTILIAYRRYQHGRLQADQKRNERRTSRDEPDDLWRAGGQRLTEQVELEEKDDEDNIPFWEDEDDDDDDEKDNSGWRRG